MPMHVRLRGPCAAQSGITLRLTPPSSPRESAAVLQSIESGAAAAEVGISSSSMDGAAAGEGKKGDTGAHEAMVSTQGSIRGLWI